VTENFNIITMTDSRFFTNKGPLSLKFIADNINCNLIPPETDQGANAENTNIEDLNTLEHANDQEITFFSNSKYLNYYLQTKALACIISEQYIEQAPKHIWKLISDNPYKAFAFTSQLFYPYKQVYTQSNINPSAKISNSAHIGENCHIGPNVVIEDNVQIGKNCTIDAGAVIKQGVVIGDNANIGANVVIAYSIIGDDALIFPGACIGQDGFGFATDKGRHYKVVQLGRVVIGNDVEIGAGTTIDRGTIGDTKIGDFCRIDNLVQIAHNVVLGKGCVIVSQVGIAGSSEIGDYCVLGGQVGIAGHLTLGSYSQVAGQSGLTKNFPEKSILGGSPAQPLRDWHKQQIILKNLQNKQAT
jgi:UDP-3-O-[3-hydroxymyristoyl] glucosamine N-acyltransferase